MRDGNERIGRTATIQGGEAGIFRSRNEASGKLVGGLVEDGEPQHGVGGIETMGIGEDAGLVFLCVVYLLAKQDG
jgi:hypothetical protein